MPSHLPPVEAQAHEILAEAFARVRALGVRVHSTLPAGRSPSVYHRDLQRAGEPGYPTLTLEREAHEHAAKT